MLLYSALFEWNSSFSFSVSVSLLWLFQSNIVFGLLVVEVVVVFVVVV